MRLWETYFRLWKRFGDSLTEKTTVWRPTGNFDQDDDCITNYYGSVYDTCSVSGIRR